MGRSAFNSTTMPGLVLAMSAMMLSDVLWAAPKTATSLTDMFSEVRANATVSRDIMPLKRDWIGDIKNGKGETTRMRLEKGQIVIGKIFLMRTYPDGSCIAGDQPVYLGQIPTRERIHECHTVSEPRAILGDGRPGMDGWGGPKGVHSSHSWVCFSPVNGEKLIYLSVFAHTSSTAEQRKGGMIQKPLPPKQWVETGSNRRVAA